MTPTEKQLVGWVKQVGADLGQLDVLVEDVKCQQANRVNAGGTIAQIRYLLRFQTPEQVRELVQHEMKILRRYHMQQQSKTRPEKNRRRRNEQCVGSN